jgi:xanthine dehydrogenase accessory factor
VFVAAFAKIAAKGPKMNFFNRLADLERERATFAVATVIARNPALSSHPGDRAVIHADGRMEGFVGGSLARDVVRREALRTIRSGKPALLQIRPEGTRDDVSDPSDPNGSVDVYIEPHLPPRIFVIVGHTPIAESLAQIAAASAVFEVVRVVADDESGDALDIPSVRVVAIDALRPFLNGIAPVDRGRMIAIVASQSRYDERALEAILRSRVAFVGLVASRIRARAILDALAREGFSTETLATIRHLEGDDAGTRDAPEIAVSVLSETFREAAATMDAVSRASVQTSARYVTDPVCQTDVSVATASTLAEYHGTTYYFCSAGCRSAFVANPSAFLTAVEVW